MKLRQRIAKSDVATAVDPTDESKKPKTHRLTGISVNEVSIVDRAANKRNYIVVKRDGVLHVEKDVPPGGQPQPAPPAQPTAPVAPTLRISPELKAKVTGILTTAQERIGIISKVLEGSSETPGAPPPQELMDALTQLAQLFAADAAPPTPPPPAAQPPAPAAKDATEKAGRKISQARLTQLTQMRSTLDALIADASGAKTDAADDDEEDEKEPAKKGDPVQPPIGGSPIGDPPVKKPDEGDEEDEAKKKPPQQDAPPQDGSAQQTQQELSEIRQAVAVQTELMAKMALLFESQNARVNALSKSRGNSLQPDLDVPVEKSQQRVVWDLDMARPMKTVQ